MKIVHENCDLEKCNNIKLPNTAYVVTYKVDGGECNDITISQKQVEIFDHYYDKYKKDLIDIQQSDGTANHKLWKSQEEMQKSSKKK